MTDKAATPALVREQAAEIEYLRARNLNLSGAIDDLAVKLETANKRIAELEGETDAGE